MNEENQVSTEIEDNTFYEVTDPDTKRKYMIPDMSGNVDVLKAVNDAAESPSRYAPEVKVAAAALYVVLPSSRKVARMLDLNDRTIRYWRHEPWWHVVTREVRKTKNEELDAQLTDLLELSVGELADRITNGETVIDQKTGQLRVIPVKTRDLAGAMHIVFDKREMLRRDPVSNTKETAVSEHLANVAEKLEKLVGKIPEPVVVEGEFREENE